MPSHPTDAPLAPGAWIEGRYVVGETIGRGGAGTVVAGYHVALDAPVAIKFLRPAALSHDARKRFMREARLTNRLKSAHAVRVHDVGELPTGELYLVMERLVGRTLGDELRARGPLPEHEAAELVAQACEAVGEAHALGIVHRDLKPHNLFLHEGPLGPVVKVLDFGLSKEVEGASPGAPQHTRTFMFMGTPRYMPPEQWEPGAVADPRMDVFALGVILHELLTGQVPFEHVPLKERAPLILGASVPNPRAIRSSVSERMAEVVIGCLKPRAEDRIPSARHLERMLRALAASSASAGGGGATLMLSKVVQTKTAPGLVRSPHAATPAPEPRAVPPRLKPTLALPPEENPFHRASSTPPVGSAPPVGSLPPPEALVAPPAELPIEEEEGGSSRTVVILVLVLLLLAIASAVALLEATGRLR